ncbi:BHLH domain-containing protein [Aphelenchoides fujianensis]|nr:BHLH domain-containing protein [Aphelenchoides fujianensis]
MERAKDNHMELGENLFLHDPFLSLDSDLDDVSEVIRSNLLGEQPGLFDGSRTPSPQYMRDTDVFVPADQLAGDYFYPREHTPYTSNPASNKDSYDKEIGQIVSLLQDERQNPLLSSPGPSMQQSAQFAHSPLVNGVQIKPDYSMMETMSDVYEMNAPVQHQFPRSNSSPSMDVRMDFQQVPQANVYGIPQASFQPHLQNHVYSPPNQYDQATTSGIYAHDSSKSNPHLANGHMMQVVDETIPQRQNMDACGTYEQNGTPANQSTHETKQELIKMLLDMSPSDLDRLRSQKSQQRADRKQPNSPTPVDPVRKRPSLQIPAPNSPLQPLLVSIGEHYNLSSTSLDSAANAHSSTFSPSLVSPESSTSGVLNEWREESDNEDGAHQPNGRKGPRTERRTAHNLIEKKYRCSINDRINHLKEMLAPEETKLSKSATLRKAIEHIMSLRQQNVDLLRENDLLKQSIKALGGEPPVLVPQSNKFVRPSASLQSRDSSESPTSNQSSVSNSPRRSKKSTAPMLNQSRVSLCVFMLMVVMWNPFAVLFGGSNETTRFNAEPTGHIVGRVPVPHRTLKAFGNGEYSFDAENDVIDWWHRAFTRHALVWLINLLIVFLILTRLLIHGEPVADRRSPAWITFLKAKQNAMDAITSCNYKEAQRQLREALYILGRPLPRPGGVEEFMSVTWQVIRHLLNVVWIGRWFSRRRRSKTISAPAVCRSHATTALIYHQLNQLHLLGIDAVDNGRMSGLNLALSAANLAESAGISRDGVSHQQRADIYIHAALRMKLSLPRFLGRITSAYFFRRARRHVQKSASVDNVEMKCYRWVFHPLARNFLADVDAVREILTNGRQLAHFPFVNPLSSPKPIDRMTAAFKMHLLALLMNQLNSTNPTLRVVDFVDISHLLLNISTSDLMPFTEETRETAPKDEVADDWESLAKGQGDELCTWWAHVITCGLYWKYGDNQRAQKHYALIRKCPKLLLNSNLALGLGMGLCTRKICNDDRSKKDFANMVWFHAKGAYAHVQREGWNARKSSSMATAMNTMVRCMTFDWILNSLLDVWQLTLDGKQLYWEQAAPSQMRRLYHEVLSDYRVSSRAGADRFKVLTFKLLGRLLDGANPLTTWKLLSRNTPDSNGQSDIIKRLRNDLQISCKV